MKRLVIAVIVLAAIAGGIALKPKTIEYIAPEVIEVEKTVIQKDKDVRIKEAQDSARAEVETKAQQAYQSAYDHEMSVIKERVLTEYKAELDAELVETQKKNKTY